MPSTRSKGPRSEDLFEDQDQVLIRERELEILSEEETEIMANTSHLEEKIQTLSSQITILTQTMATLQQAIPASQQQITAPTFAALRPTTAPGLDTPSNQERRDSSNRHHQRRSPFDATPAGAGEPQGGGSSDPECPVLQILERPLTLDEDALLRWVDSGEPADTEPLPAEDSDSGCGEDDEDNPEPVSEPEQEPEDDDSDARRWLIPGAARVTATAPPEIPENEEEELPEDLDTLFEELHVTSDTVPAVTPIKPRYRRVSNPNNQRRDSSNRHHQRRSPFDATPAGAGEPQGGGSSDPECPVLQILERPLTLDEDALLRWVDSGEPADTEPLPAEDSDSGCGEDDEDNPEPVSEPEQEPEDDDSDARRWLIPGAARVTATAPPEIPENEEEELPEDLDTLFEELHVTSDTVPAVTPIKPRYRRVSNPNNQRRDSSNRHHQRRSPFDATPAGAGEPQGGGSSDPECPVLQILERPLTLDEDALLRWVDSGEPADTEPLPAEDSDSGCGEDDEDNPEPVSEPEQEPEDDDSDARRWLIPGAARVTATAPPEIPENEEEELPEDLDTLFEELHVTSDTVPAVTPIKPRYRRVSNPNNQRRDSSNRHHQRRSPFDATPAGAGEPQGGGSSDPECPVLQILERPLTLDEDALLRWVDSGEPADTEPLPAEDSDSGCGEDDEDNPEPVSEPEQEPEDDDSDARRWLIPGAARVTATAPPEIPENEEEELPEDLDTLFEELHVTSDTVPAVTPIKPRYRRVSNPNNQRRDSSNRHHQRRSPFDATPAGAGEPQGGGSSDPECPVLQILERPLTLDEDALLRWVDSGEPADTEPLPAKDSDSGCGEDDEDNPEPVSEPEQEPEDDDSDARRWLIPGAARVTATAPPEIPENEEEELPEDLDTLFEELHVTSDTVPAVTPIKPRYRRVSNPNNQRRDSSNRHHQRRSPFDATPAGAGEPQGGGSSDPECPVLQILERPLTLDEDALLRWVDSGEPADTEPLPAEDSDSGCGEDDEDNPEPVSEPEQEPEDDDSDARRWLIPGAARVTATAPPEIPENEEEELPEDLDTLFEELHVTSDTVPAVTPIKPRYRRVSNPNNQRRDSSNRHHQRRSPFDATPAGAGEPQGGGSSDPECPVLQILERPLTLDEDALLRWVDSGEPADTEPLPAEDSDSGCGEDDEDNPEPVSEPEQEPEDDDSDARRWLIPGAARVTATAPPEIPENEEEELPEDLDTLFEELHVTSDTVPAVTPIKPQEETEIMANTSHLEEKIQTLSSQITILTQTMATLQQAIPASQQQITAPTFAALRPTTAPGLDTPSNQE
ncbi:uncharacterized protein, partial [Hetaerina americana]|uniref:uncharacterized protein n=1 Tax=Hetaerina americana TaxID=62018 RepID=UPI003A7F517D